MVVSTRRSSFSVPSLPTQSTLPNRNRRRTLARSAAPLIPRETTRATKTTTKPAVADGPDAASTVSEQLVANNDTTIQTTTTTHDTADATTQPAQSSLNFLYNVDISGCNDLLSLPDPPSPSAAVSRRRSFSISSFSPLQDLTNDIEKHSSSKKKKKKRQSLGGQLTRSSSPLLLQASPKKVSSSSSKRRQSMRLPPMVPRQATTRGSSSQKKKSSLPPPIKHQSFKNKTPPLHSSKRNTVLLAEHDDDDEEEGKNDQSPSMFKNYTPQPQQRIVVVLAEDEEDGERKPAAQVEAPPPSSNKRQRMSFLLPSDAMNVAQILDCVSSRDDTSGSARAQRVGGTNGNDDDTKPRARETMKSCDDAAETDTASPDDATTTTTTLQDQMARVRNLVRQYCDPSGEHRQAAAVEISDHFGYPLDGDNGGGMDDLGPVVQHMEQDKQTEKARFQQLTGVRYERSRGGRIRYLELSEMRHRLTPLQYQQVYLEALENISTQNCEHVHGFLAENDKEWAAMEALVAGGMSAHVSGGGHGTPIQGGAQESTGEKDSTLCIQASSSEDPTVGADDEHRIPDAMELAVVADSEQHDVSVIKMGSMELSPDSAGQPSAAMMDNQLASLGQEHVDSTESDMEQSCDEEAPLTDDSQVMVQEADPLLPPTALPPLPLPPRDFLPQDVELARAHLQLWATIDEALLTYSQQVRVLSATP